MRFSLHLGFMLGGYETNIIITPLKWSFQKLTYRNWEENGDSWDMGVGPFWFDFYKLRKTHEA